MKRATMLVSRPFVDMLIMVTERPYRSIAQSYVRLFEPHSTLIELPVEEAQRLVLVVYAKIEGVLEKRDLVCEDFISWVDGRSVDLTADGLRWLHAIQATP